jgi:Flp pilus assembly pilin Flp
MQRAQRGVAAVEYSVLLSCVALMLIGAVGPVFEGGAGAFFEVSASFESTAQAERSLGSGGRGGGSRSGDARGGTSSSTDGEVEWPELIVTAEGDGDSNSPAGQDESEE